MELTSTEPAWVPRSCTLPTAERPLRVAEFDELFGTATEAVKRTADGVRLELLPDPDVAARAAGLAMRETACCSFFAFTLTAAAGTLFLDVTADPAHREVLDALAERAAAVPS